MTVQGTLPTGSTRVAAVIGTPIRHSLSPTLLNAAFTATGTDWVYCAFEVDAPEVAAAVAATRTLGLAGLSVTMPLKSVILDHLDALDDAAERLEAVNCVVERDGRLVGYSTDGPGLLDTLRIDEAYDPAHKRCVVLGAGGAARAAILALAEAGAREVVVVNRTVSRAANAAGLAGTRGRVGVPGDVADADLVVNATPVGMAGSPVSEHRFDEHDFGAGQLVFDMIYDPAETPLVAMARRGGARAAGGVGMLVHQAAHAFSLWTGEPAPTAAMAAAARAELAHRSR